MGYCLTEAVKMESLQCWFDQALVLGFRHITCIGRNHSMVPMPVSSAQSAGKVQSPSPPAGDICPSVAGQGNVSVVSALPSVSTNVLGIPSDPPIRSQGERRLYTDCSPPRGLCADGSLILYCSNHPKVSEVETASW